MFNIVRRQVMAAIKNSQVPWEASSFAGTYYIEVHDGRDDKRSVSSYRLRASMGN